MRLFESVQKIVSPHPAPSDVPEAAERIPRTAARAASGASKIVIQSPRRLDETAGILDDLQSGCSVRLNLQSGNYETARRLLDFVAGFAYHNENKVWKIARNTFLIVPYDAEVQAIGFPQYVGAGN